MDRAERATEQATERVAVTGSNGQVGRRLVEHLRREKPGATILSLDRENFDLSEPANLASLLDEMEPTLIFHAGAYTAVDHAEREAELCLRVNRDATVEIARWCKAHSVPLVFFSTDYVFSGDETDEYSIESPRAPKSVYGRSKAEAERAIEDLALNGLIIRTQWVYDVDGKNFPNTMLRLMKEGKPLRVVSDQVGSPTFAKDLAQGAIQLTEFFLDWDEPGVQIRHVTNAGHVSWHAFAEEIQRMGITEGMLKKGSPIEAIPSSAYAAPAPRPLNGRLDLRETDRDGVHLRSWSEALQDYFKDLKEKAHA